MAYSLHVICTTPDDYSCNEVIIIAESRLGLLKKLLALFFTSGGKVKFKKGFDVSAKERKSQNNPLRISNNHRFVIQKRIEENKLYGKIAEVALYFVLGYEVAHIAIELGIDEKSAGQYLSDLKTHFKVNTIEEIIPTLTLRNNLLPVVPPIPSVPPADTTIK